MEQRFQQRLEELLDEARVQPSLLRGLLPRLERFLQPFAPYLQRSEQAENAHRYVAGLLSNLRRKNVEAIAYYHDQERQALQKFIGQAPWAWEPLLTELTRQVARELGEGEGVLVFDPSAFPKCGTKSVGVQRQWCGRLGKIDNCQVGIYLGYVSRHEHTLVDVRLYLPRLWATDKRRRREAGVPRHVRFRTRHQLALDMLDDRGASLPHAWVAGDDEMGRSTWFRQALRERRERYLLAVPANTLVRDLEATPPPYRGRGPHPQVAFVRAERWREAVPEGAWTTVEVRAGAKGPLVVQAVKARVRAKTDQRRAGPEELLVVMRTCQGDGSYKHDYYLSNAAAETGLEEVARVAKAEHRIEECLRRAKSEAGLAAYQVRTWEGWHHHQTLSLIAGWFLVQETRRGKKADAGVNGAPAGGAACLALTQAPGV
jgi:SRSO17 transposase